MTGPTPGNCYLRQVCPPKWSTRLTIVMADFLFAATAVVAQPNVPVLTVE